MIFPDQGGGLRVRGDNRSVEAAPGDKLQTLGFKGKGTPDLEEPEELKECPPDRKVRAPSRDPGDPYKPRRSSGDVPGTGFRMPAATSQGQSVEDLSGTDTKIISITRIAAVSGRGRDATVELLCPYVARKAGIPR